ncbi:MAG: efflux RND transporter periplasmic adaptor subunit [Parachlamydiaceae bacterium]|nr:efflux RND transporter periplasmic adaptor subunit [Parachlamydiaceae bacterium]
MRRFILIVLFTAVLLAAATLLYRYEHPEDPNTITLYGNVDVRQVDLGFRANGRVISMPFQEGDWITPGTLMAEIDKKPYSDRVLEATAALASTKINTLNAKKVLNRREELHKLGDGSVSIEDYENAQAAYEALQANLNQAEATLELANTNLRDTDIYAPAEGIILTRIRQPGTVVREGDPVYTLSLISPVWIRAFIPEPYLGIVIPGMEAEIYTDTPDGKSYKGRVGFISPVAEFTPKTVETTQLRTDLVYRLRIIADNPDQGLRQGMPVTVKLHPKSPNETP